MICRICKDDKNEDEFYWKNKIKEIKQLECKDCTKQMTSNHYQNNKQYYKNRTKLNSDCKRKWLREYKSTLKCSKCNENHVACLEFHHIDPNLKDKEVSTIVNSNWSIERIKNEISKCIVLCSNCHRKLHWEEKNGPVAQLDSEHSATNGEV
jgi:hypothetical protein